jgi:hypothetical protein
MAKKIKNELKPTLCWQRDYLMPLGDIDLAPAWLYSTPQEAWKSWSDIKNMLWLLKRLNVDNRVLSKCLLEIFEHYHPRWRGLAGRHSEYKLPGYITAVKNYIAGKEKLPFLRKQFKELQKVRWKLEKMGRADPFNNPFERFRGIVADIYVLLYLIINGYKEQCGSSWWWFVLYPDETDKAIDSAGVQREKVKAWARDHIREYFPDPTIFLADVLAELDSK